MFDFLKTIGQGALYLVLSPFILLGVALYSVYAILLFFVMFIKRIVLFFRGENMKEEMRIDVVAKMHLQNQDEEKSDKQENKSIEVPMTNVIKEEKTTIVQPIIIQTDEEGRLKGVQYLNPQGPSPALESLDKVDAIEAKKEELPSLEENKEEEL